MLRVAICAKELELSVGREQNLADLGWAARIKVSHSTSLVWAKKVSYVFCYM